ncbi:uncharacterized protein [Haliotis cracherodii]|uniref:uncharacterized protein n=1 Tax=Haliotis cracherodii TaxID=6455 RepID=UPI0039E78FCB
MLSTGEPIFEITTGILAMVISLGIVVFILRRFPICVERHGSSTSPPPEAITQPGPAGNSGNDHDSNDWTTKYWEIHDRDVNSTSSCSKTTHNEVIQLRRKNDQIRKPLTIDEQPNVLGRSRTNKRPLSEPTASKTSSLPLLGATSHVKGDGLRSKSVHDECNITISPEVQELIKKTDSIIFIEQNCDLSKVSATYLSPKADTCYELHHTNELGNTD